VKPLKTEYEKIGMEARLTVENITVAVTIIDVRQAYGRIDYLVSPVSGDGKQWVSASRLNIM